MPRFELRKFVVPEVIFEVGAIPQLICSAATADISPFAIISEVARRTQVAIIGKIVVPDVALLDPAATLTVDP